ncbi:T-box transcription factor TBX21 [Ambystoma mexicanum]|uniref:T-box transcription factor TBX21 n=1 Tax=Ambystoma mexicanum TaxID=8296 RepID=UPI0037E70709
MGALDQGFGASSATTMLGAESQGFAKELAKEPEVLVKDLPEVKLGLADRLYCPEPGSPDSCALNFAYTGQPGFGVGSQGRFLSPMPLNGYSYSPVRPQATGTNGYSVPTTELYAPGASELYPVATESSYSGGGQHGFPRGVLYPMPGYQSVGKLQVVLNNYPLWAKFHKHQTEMIITKQGRRMFPFLSFNVSGMDPMAHYNVFVDIVLADQHHWRYQGGKWVQCGKAEGNMPGNRIYMHPDSPNTGAHWMRQEILFGKLKLTNNKGASNNLTQMVVLQSLHKYQPRLHIAEVTEGELEEFSASKTQTFTFPETQFVAVTAYQNADITQLKIDHNPFAKGFRDNFDSMYTVAEGERQTPSPQDASGCQQLLTSTRYPTFLHEQYQLPQSRFYGGDRPSPHSSQHKDPLGAASTRWYLSAQQASSSHLDYSTYDVDYSGSKFAPYTMKPFPLQSSPHHALGYYQDLSFSAPNSWASGRSATQYQPKPSTGMLSWLRHARDTRPPSSAEERSKDVEGPAVAWTEPLSVKTLNTADSTVLYDASECKRRRVSPYASSAESSPPQRNGEHYEKEGTDGGYYSFYSSN